MDNKKIGGILIIIAISVGLILFFYNSKLSTQSREIGCFQNPNCLPLEKELSLSHLAIGIFSFIFSLGIYLLLFNKTDQKIFERFENEKNEKIQEEKFKYILMALNDYEKKAIKIIKNQEGITQSNLRIKSDMSKAKLSYVLQELEQRNLIKRIKKGKTLAIFLKI